jgi:DNA-binding NarL/FixJ family response regulator
VVGEADGLEALAGLGFDAPPDVVVADSPDLGPLGPPGPGERPPGLVVLGPVPGDAQLPALLAGRAWAYVPRAAGGEQVVAAVRAVAAGLLAIEAGVGHHLLARPSPEAALASEEAGEELTGREREVLHLVAMGLANKAIARRLAISEHTVKFHVAAILTKLGAGSRTEAVHLAARRGLVAL